jgi:hypothetical protein
VRNIWFLNIFQIHIRTLDYRSNFSSNFIVLFYWILQTIIHYFPGITRFIIVVAISKKKEPIRSSVDEFQFWEKGLVQIGQTITSVQPDVFWQRWYFTYPLRFDFVYYTQLVYTEEMSIEEKVGCNRPRTLLCYVRNSRRNSRLLTILHQNIYLTFTHLI